MKTGKNKDEEKIILINLNEDLKTDSSQFAYYEQQFKENRPASFRAIQISS